LGIRIERTAEIAAAPDVVWDVISDVERWPEWQPGTKSIVRRGSGAFGPGSEARVTMKGSRGAIWRVTDYAEGRSFSWESGVMPGVHMVGHHSVEGAGAGSRATLALDIEGPLAGPLGRLLRWYSERNVARESAGLKRVSEARAGVPAS
jgi:carbon monoxide dehydrogenase subunit G